MQKYCVMFNASSSGQSTHYLYCLMGLYLIFKIYLPLNHQILILSLLINSDILHRIHICCVVVGSILSTMHIHHPLCVLYSTYLYRYYLGVKYIVCYLRMQKSGSTSFMCDKFLQKQYSIH